MNFIDHDHKHTVKRGGSIMSGSSNYQDDNVVIDTPEYNKFDLSHSFKSTGKLGVFNPCLRLDVIAGDNLKMNIGMTQYFRPLQTKIVNELETSMHLFYLPLRMLDYSFEKFITGGVDGKWNKNLLNFTIPVSSNINRTQKQGPKFHSVPFFGAGSLLDGFNYGVCPIYTSGVVTNTYSAAGTFNLFPLIAYHMVYNDYYRAEEIETDLWCPSEAERNDGQDYGFPEVYVNAFQSLLRYSSAEDKTVIPIEKFINALHTDARFKGFGRYMLTLLTEPNMRSFLHMLTDNEQIDFDFTKNRIVLSSLIDNVELVADSYEICLCLTGNVTIETFLYSNLCQLFVLYLLSSELMPWERDRFTTALPYLQRGVTEYIDKNLSFISSRTTDNPLYYGRVGSSVSGNLYKMSDASYGYIYGSTNIAENHITMDDIRRLNAVTRFLEKNARIGYRFDEWISGIFGIEQNSPDILSKPTYIGGLKNNVDVERITATAETDTTYLGDYGGQATGFANSDSIDFACKEHGVIIGVYGTKPRTSYMFHIDRSNMKYGDRTVFYTPDFAKLQEQPLFAGEIEANFGSANLSALINGEVAHADADRQFFGYIPRYEEYRSMINTTHGELVHNLSYFTTARTEEGIDSNSDLMLQNNYDFQHISPDDPCVNRIFPYDANISDHFVSSIGFNISKLSLMPSQATPAI